MNCGLFVGTATGSGYVPKLRFLLIPEQTGAAESSRAEKIPDEPHTFRHKYYQPFEVEGVKFTPLTVEHGPRFSCLGFMFGDVVYISDVSEVPGPTMELLKSKPLELLVVDCLSVQGGVISHFIFDQAMELVREIRPKKVFLTGMNHTIDHEKTNEYLRDFMASEGLDIQLAYDGACVPVSSL